MRNARGNSIIDCAQARNELEEVAYATEQDNNSLHYSAPALITKVLLNHSTYNRIRE